MNGMIKEKQHNHMNKYTIPVESSSQSCVTLPRLSSWPKVSAMLL